MVIVIWVDQEVYNEENSEYLKELEEMKSFKIRCFKSVSEAMHYIKDIDFEETKIIVSGRLYKELINSFKANIRSIKIAPIIKVFTGNEQRFLDYNQDYKNLENSFYNFGGIATIIDEVKEFLNDKKNSFFISQNDNSTMGTTITNSLDVEDGSKKFENLDDIELTFEYIDSIEKLELHLFFKALIEYIPYNNIEENTKLIYNNYYNELEIQNLLRPILDIPNIPIEILSKYYARLLTFCCDFHKDLNKDLRLNKKEKYLTFIKMLYEGVKLKSLPLATDTILYRGNQISNEEINKIKEHQKKKLKNLPSSIVFSKSFLSFSKDRKTAEKFFKNEIKKENLSKILFIIEKDKDNNEGYNSSTHGDIESISFYPSEREVLFFPFSSFEIKDINDIIIGDEKGYEIKLVYLGKYIPYIENEKKVNKIPETEFSKQICEIGLIDKDKINLSNTKNLYNMFKIYEKEIKVNLIIGEFDIKSEDVDKDIQIINSFENFKKENNYEDREDDWLFNNEKEIKDNIEIKINGQKIEFSYKHKFKKEGKYAIEYISKNNLTNTNYMFADCSDSLTSLDFTNFDTKNVTKMSKMFYCCSSLKNINLTNFNTENVINMGGIFHTCNSLTSLNLSSFNTKNLINMGGMFHSNSSLKTLDLSNFNTKNATNMGGMFNGCESLISLDLSNFNTEKVTIMGGMFNNCFSLKNINLSSFNTQNVHNMGIMFYGCKSLTSLNLSSFYTQSATNLGAMFCGCESLTYLNLSNFNTQKVINMSNIFTNCKSLQKKNLITKDNKILALLNN